MCHSNHVSVCCHNLEPNSAKSQGCDNFMQLSAFLVIYVRFISLMVGIYQRIKDSLYVLFIDIFEFFFLITVNLLLSFTINVMFDIIWECDFAPSLLIIYYTSPNILWGSLCNLTKRLAVMY